MTGAITGERIVKRLEELGLDQSELARRVNCSPAAINLIVSGKTQRSRYLAAIATKLRLPLSYLTGDVDDPEDWEAPALQGGDVDGVEVQEIDLAYGMGGGTFLDDVPVTARTRRFSREWLRMFTPAPPDQLYWATGAGDSMSPTILDSDIVLIDRSQTHLQTGDRIWAASFGGVGVIKRLRPMPDGRLKILSDNPSVPEDFASEGELYLLGRVVAKVSKL